MGRRGGCLAPHLGAGGAGFRVSCLAAAAGSVPPSLPSTLWEEVIIAEVRLWTQIPHLETGRKQTKVAHLVESSKITPM